MKITISFFCLSLLATVLLTGCVQSPDKPTPTTISNHSNESAFGEFYLTINPGIDPFTRLTKTENEVGDTISFSLLPLTNASIPAPTKLTLTITKPDGTTSTLQESVVNERETICGMSSGEAPPPCWLRSPKPFFTYATLDSFLIEQTGNYTINATMEGNNLKIRGYSFEIKLNRIDPVLVLKNFSGYTLQQKRTDPLFGTGGPWPGYQAIYESNQTRNNQTAVKREMVVTIIVFNSNVEAKKEAQFYLDNYGSTLFEGQRIIYLTNEFERNRGDSNSYTWPSKNFVVSIEGVQAYGENENAFLREYLEKYPTSLN